MSKRKIINGRFFSSIDTIERMTHKENYKLKKRFKKINKRKFFKQEDI